MMKKIILPWLIINKYIGIEIEANKDLNIHDFINKIDKIKLNYEKLSSKYQNTKLTNNIPLK